ncbi:hypothetical protein LR48_Vigan05g087000 [Vigna angularis]|uniref:Uncharacterized protein n=1 Tax=Phaseolus angularis TaxID=3914 RepID=A0A0L9UKP4_PHAAN|nr:hypothetical protein LR48_Vigan05g087000 [Vigna angularis]
MDQSHFGHAIGQFYREPQQQWQQQPSLSEIWAKMDETLQQLMQMSDSHHKRNQAAFTRIGSQLGHIIQKLDDLGSNMKANLREECQVIITRSYWNDLKEELRYRRVGMQKSQPECRKVNQDAGCEAWVPLRGGLSTRKCHGLGPVFALF